MGLFNFSKKVKKLLHTKISVNMNYQLSQRSKKEYDTLHKDLQKVIDLALKVSQIDFAVVEGARTAERQQMLFDTKKSKVNPKNYTPQQLITKGKHIVNEFRKESWAFDFIACVPGKPNLAYDITHLMYLVGVFTACGEILYNKGEISHKIRSGANWDRDGELRYDQTFFDSPHIEII